MIKLDNRLQTIYNAIRNNKKVIDVGSDHGHLAVKLLLDQKCPSCVCTDINPKCLKKSQNLAQEYNILNKLQFYNTDGLTNISPDDGDDIVIAGMGSNLIINIIDKCNWLKQKNDKHLILQPMIKPWLLRDYLHKNNFKIITEHLTISKNFFYIIIVATFYKYTQPLTDIDKYIGLLLNNPNEHTKNYFFTLSQKFDTISKNILLNSNDIKKSNYYKNLSISLKNKSNNL